MDLVNDAKNHHYLPQVEQRFNAINPNALAGNQKIYSFRLVDRERLSLQIEHPKGRLISKTMSLVDLFSFDVGADKTRANFEALFARYETDTRDLTQRLLKILNRDGVTQAAAVPVRDPELYDVLLQLFGVKLLNFARNPHSIKKALNTFGGLAAFEPTSPVKKAYFDRIISGNRPHQRALCARLGIEEYEYVAWLKMLFMLFIEYDPEGNSILSGIVKSLFDSRSQAIGVMVCTYDDPWCLLSDRGSSTSIERTDLTGFDFNVTSRCFARYVMGPAQAFVPHVPASLIANVRRSERELFFHHRKNDMDILDGFNRNVIYQCDRRVYSASKSPRLPSQNF